MLHVDGKGDIAFVIFQHLLFGYEDGIRQFKVLIFTRVFAVAIGGLESTVADIIQCPATAFCKLRQYQLVFVGLNHFSHPATPAHTLRDGVVANLGIAGSNDSVGAFYITRLLHPRHHGGGKGKVLASQDIIGIHLNNHILASISTARA